MRRSYNGKAAVKQVEPHGMNSAASSTDSLGLPTSITGLIKSSARLVTLLKNNLRWKSVVTQAFEDLKWDTSAPVLKHPDS